MNLFKFKIKTSKIPIKNVPNMTDSKPHPFSTIYNIFS